MTSNRTALQVFLALAARLEVSRQTKFLAAAIFTDRYRDEASWQGQLCQAPCHRRSFESFSLRASLHDNVTQAYRLYDRCIPVLDKDRPVALPCQEDTLCTLVCLSKAADKHSKEDGISMADIQTAAAEVYLNLFCNYLP